MSLIKPMRSVKMTKLLDCSQFNRHIISFEALTSVTCMELGIDGLRNFFPHLNDEQMALRHEGAIRAEPPQKPEKPVPGVDHYSDLLKAYDRDLSLYNAYNSAMIDLIYTWLEHIPDSDRLALENLDPVQGLATLTCNKIYNYLLRKYGSLTESAKNSLIAVVTKELSLSMSLDANLTEMRTANNSLSVSGIGFTEFQMFGFAYDKLRKNPRTADIAEDYKKRDGYVPSQATFTDFFTFVVNQYDVRSPPPSTAAYAFNTDSDFSLITPVKKSEPDPEPLAAAIISPGKTITLTEDEYKSLVSQAALASPKKSGKNTADLRPAPGYCILCGFCGHGPGLTGKDGKPMFCHKMADKDGNPLPNTTYVKDQIFCKKSEGGPIKNMPRSQRVDPRFKKP